MTSTIERDALATECASTVVTYDLGRAEIVRAAVEAIRLVADSRRDARRGRYLVGRV